MRPVPESTGTVISNLSCAAGKNSHPSTMGISGSAKTPMSESTFVNPQITSLPAKPADAGSITNADLVQKPAADSAAVAASIPPTSEMLKVDIEKLNPKLVSSGTPAATIAQNALSDKTASETADLIKQINPAQKRDDLALPTSMSVESATLGMAETKSQFRLLLEGCSDLPSGRRVIEDITNLSKLLPLNAIKHDLMANQTMLRATCLAHDAIILGSTTEPGQYRLESPAIICWRTNPEAELDFVSGYANSMINMLPAAVVPHAGIVPFEWGDDLDAGHHNIESTTPYCRYSEHLAAPFAIRITTQAGIAANSIFAGSRNLADTQQEADERPGQRNSPLTLYRNMVEQMISYTLDENWDHVSVLQRLYLLLMARTPVEFAIPHCSANDAVYYEDSWSARAPHDSRGYKQDFEWNTSVLEDEDPAVLLAANRRAARELAIPMQELVGNVVVNQGAAVLYHNLFPDGARERFPDGYPCARQTMYGINTRTLAYVTHMHKAASEPMQMLLRANYSYAWHADTGFTGTWMDGSRMFSLVSTLFSDDPNHAIRRAELVSAQDFTNWVKYQDVGAIPAELPAITILNRMLEEEPQAFALLPVAFYNAIGVVIPLLPLLPTRELVLTGLTRNRDITISISLLAWQWAGLWRAAHEPTHQNIMWVYSPDTNLDRNAATLRALARMTHPYAKMRMNSACEFEYGGITQPNHAVEGYRRKVAGFSVYQNYIIPGAHPTVIIYVSTTKPNPIGTLTPGQWPYVNAVGMLAQRWRLASYESLASVINLLGATEYAVAAGGSGGSAQIALARLTTLCGGPMLPYTPAAPIWRTGQRKDASNCIPRVRAVWAEDGGPLPGDRRIYRMIRGHPLLVSLMAFSMGVPGGEAALWSIPTNNTVAYATGWVLHLVTTIFSPYALTVTPHANGNGLALAPTIARGGPITLANAGALYVPVLTAVEYWPNCRAGAVSAIAALPHLVGGNIPGTVRALFPAAPDGYPIQIDLTRVRLMPVIEIYDALLAMLADETTVYLSHRGLLGAPQIAYNGGVCNFAGVGGGAQIDAATLALVAPMTLNLTPEVNNPGALFYESDVQRPEDVIQFVPITVQGQPFSRDDSHALIPTTRYSSYADMVTSLGYLRVEYNVTGFLSAAVDPVKPSMQTEPWLLAATFRSASISASALAQTQILLYDIPMQIRYGHSEAATERSIPWQGLKRDVQHQLARLDFFATSANIGTTSNTVFNRRNLLFYVYASPYAAFFSENFFQEGTNIAARLTALMMTLGSDPISIITQWVPDSRRLHTEQWDRAYGIDSFSQWPYFQSTFGHSATWSDPTWYDISNTASGMGKAQRLGVMNPTDKRLMRVRDLLSPYADLTLYYTNSLPAIILYHQADRVGELQQLVPTGTNATIFSTKKWCLFLAEAKRVDEDWCRTPLIQVQRWGLNPAYPHLQAAGRHVMERSVPLAGFPASWIPGLLRRNSSMQNQKQEKGTVSCMRLHDVLWYPSGSFRAIPGSPLIELSYVLPEMRQGNDSYVSLYYMTTTEWGSQVWRPTESQGSVAAVASQARILEYL
jgi:hypothetical protein